jgi:hypothetical protein
VLRGRPLLIIALLVLADATSACRRAGPLDPDSIRQWAETAGYAWIEGPDEIRTEQAFYDYVNGAAQPIIDLGWKRSVYGVLTREGRRLRLAVHEMKSPREAIALFDQNVAGDTQPVSVGEKAVTWDRGEFSRGILFRQASLSCELVFEKEGGKEELLGLASSLAARMR